MSKVISYEELVAQNEHLLTQLEEAQDIIEAIRTGEVDAFVVKQAHGHELYTLKTADQTYRLFIEKMKDGAVTVNSEGVVLYANSSFAQMLGKPLGVVIGVQFQDLIPDKFRKLVGRNLNTAWDEERRCEIVFPRNDTDLPVMLSMNTLEIDNEISLSIIVTDLSFQKEAQQQKLALDRKDEFISIASHELKTPVTSIKGYIQLLRHTFMQEGNSNAEALLARADVQVNKLTSLIQDLLDVKTIENGNLAYQEQPFNFNELVNETLEEIKRRLNIQEIKFEPGKETIVLGDRLKIGQVITNFIDNASKYSPTASVITVSTQHQNNHIRLSVADEGIGIPAEQKELIFDRFFRVNNDVENTYAGLGLGLYICAEIVKRHHGIIGVESTQGKGSVFYFELPTATIT